MRKDSETELSDWVKKYSDKDIPAREAILKYISPGNRIFIDSGCSEPLDLTQQLMELGSQLPDVEILHFLDLSHLNYYPSHGGGRDSYRHNAFFIGANLRKAVQDGFADYTPMLLSEIPGLFKTGRVHVNCALIQVTPPDSAGDCSLGINVDIVKSIADAADFVIAEINPKMPRTMGDTCINMDKIDAFQLSDNDLLEGRYEDPDEVEQKIANYVASLVEDGSTLQMGIGKIPNAVTRYLEDKKDLGIHSEVFSDGVMDLYDKGVINGRQKTLHKGKIVTSFVMGSRRLYDFVDNNRAVEFYPVDYVNNPWVIAQNYKQVAINAALSVDFTGQCNADSIGHLLHSGIGGQADFIRGAAFSKHGKPVMVLPSTAVLPSGEAISRIVPWLEPGGGVTITRGDVHYVVTEWGIASLKGKSIRERVLQMISIAHPDFREELLQQAKDWHYVYPDQALPESVDGRISIYPERYETSYTTTSGVKLLVRPVKPTDERGLQELYYSLSDQDRYFRFFYPAKKFPHQDVQPRVTIDYSTDMILVCENSDSEGIRTIIGAGGFFKTGDPAKAELAFTINEEWQNQGITKFLLQYLIQIAREQGYRMLVGTILAENHAMLHIIQHAGVPVNFKIEQGENDFDLDISQNTQKTSKKSS
ncbi:MAG TPA: GNAT family N-acetyltransferase [Candidatus Lokiarchaeia archaeon]|nr:GNAT family N-acetyltransferase [Candidatus Lokiarchaeia archaeon]